MSATATTTTIPAGTYTADPIHSTFGFQVRHNGIQLFRGSFDDVAVTATSDGESVAIEGSAKVESIPGPPGRSRGGPGGPRIDFDLGRALDGDGLAGRRGGRSNIVEGTTEQLDAVVAHLEAERGVDRVGSVGPGRNGGGRCSGGHVNSFESS